MSLAPSMRAVVPPLLSLCLFQALAAPLTETFTYQSTLTSDANGPLDLIAELNYDTAHSNAPIAVVMHGYSGSTGKTAEVRLNAQILRDYGFFAVSVALRGRDGSDGTRDSGGVEIYDIYDAVESVKASYPALVNSNIVYITGYSGGGGNTLSALTKFPDLFNAGAAFFGMSDYGYDTTNGWYFYGADSRTSQLDIDIGDPTPPASAAVTDRYQARSSNLASANNPYSEIHIFVNDNETICPPVNSVSYCSNAVNREAFAGEFANITVHIGNSALYADFNSNSVNDANEQQYWPHGNPTADQQYAGEHWFMDRLLTGQIPKPVLNAEDRLFVAGFVKTARFACFVGDGQDGAVQLDYHLAESNLTFQTTVLSLNTQLVSHLTVNTETFAGRRLEVLKNGLSQGIFTGGGEWASDGLATGDTLELRDSGPVPIWWENISVTSIGQTSAVANATLAGATGDAWVYYGTNNVGQQREGWSHACSVGNNMATGLVTSALTNLLAGQTYACVFYATNGTLNADAWSSVVSFSTEAAPLSIEPLRIDFNDDDAGSQPVQAGFTEMFASGGTVSSGYASGGTLTITLTSGSLDDRDRGALTGGPGLEQSDLLRDFVFRNTGDGLGITLSTLKAGEYTFTGFFHDDTVQQGDGTLSVDTGDGRGEVLIVPDFAYSTGTAPATVGTASLSFLADGTHAVTVYLRDTNTVHTAPYVINGFVLEQKTYPKAVRSLAAYYDFENTFADSSGNDKHGAPSGAGVTFVADTPPSLAHSAKAADFDGTNCVALPCLGLYSALAVTNGLTISLWIKGESSAAQSWFISEGYTGNNNPAYVFGHYAGSANPTALMRNSAGTVSLNTTTATVPLYDGNWHHWAWTDFNGTAKMYIDGAFVAAAVGTWNYTRSEMPLDTTTIGAWIRSETETRTYPFLGRIDDVSVWKTVLSENQIRYLAAGGSPLTIRIIGTFIRID